VKFEPNRPGLWKAALVLGGVITLSFAAGFAAANSSGEEEVLPAYVVMSVKAITNDREKLRAYGEAVWPLAQAAGIESLAIKTDLSEMTLIEGEWPFQDGILIERYESMQAFNDYWNSDGYQNAKKLAEGLIRVNFIVAVEGRPLSSLGKHPHAEE